jgi:hypothetical protein
MLKVDDAAQPFEVEQTDTAEREKRKHPPK